MAKFFIDRPIFAWVIAIFIILAGLLSIRKLPISQYPSVAAPTITLTATYPGASAQVMEDSVLAVIERNMNGVEGLDYTQTSADASGSGSVTLTFTSSTNADVAQMNVQNKLSQILSTLPSTVQQFGVSVSKAQSNFLMVVMLSSDNVSVPDMADYAQRNIIPDLQRLEGVGAVQMFASERAMRIWVDPQKLKGYNLSFANVTSAITAQNAQISAGSLGALPSTEGQTISATITAEGQLSTPEQFGNIILTSNSNGANVYLRDVAKIELGSQSYSSGANLNGKPTVGMAVMLSNTGNAMATAELVRNKMTDLQKYFPAGVKWTAPFDTSKFVDLSIEKVIHTLIEAVVLVFLVMYLFLQNFRYTLIPTIVVPISLLGAFAGLYAFGMSINVLTMFAMVLVIGIVVDDAIVVVENVERIMAEEGLPPVEATKKAMGQITSAVIGITAVLISVFVPLAMFGGATGNIYRQFALTMVMAIGFSAFLALSLTPALCGTLLKPIPKGHHAEKKGFFGWFNRKFDTGGKRYQTWVGKLLRRSARVMLVWAALIGVASFVYTKIPAAFMPSEDQGNLMMSIQLPSGSTKERTDNTLKVVDQVVRSMPEVQDLITVSGFSFSGSGQNMAMGFVMLKDWNERNKPGSDATSMAGKITGALMGSLRDGFAIAVNPPAIRELGNSSGLEFYLQDRNGSGHAALLAKRNELLGKMRQSPVFIGSTVRAADLEDAPQLRLNINREAAAAQNVDFSSVRAVLASALGSSYVNDFPNNGRLQKVYVQADAVQRMQPEDILNLTVNNSQGIAVPLSTFMSVSWETGVEQSVRYNGFSAMSLSASVNPAYSTGAAMAEVKKMAEDLGNGYSIEWSGQSREQQNNSGQIYWLYGFAVLAVFLALAALYESWSIPLAVILVVPLGFLGVVLGVFGRNMGGLMLGSHTFYASDIFFQVGLITVVGLSAKNAILIVEFAKDLQAQGQSAAAAALSAAHLRFRPILMTSFAFILGVVPLYIASGASSASQRAIGTTVFWGMTIGTLLSVFFVPVFFVSVRKLFKDTPRQQQRFAEMAAHDGIDPEMAKRYVIEAEEGLSEEERKELNKK